nr:alpha/beta hydrolase [Qipengyuania algicida]
MAVPHENPDLVIDRRAIPADAIESEWLAWDGWRIRRIDWPVGMVETRGSILFMPGRGDFYEKYLESLEQWHRQGWRVTAADWRGQAGSGRLGKDAVTGHIDDFSIWIDDLAALWREWCAGTDGPHILIGHSMGGHLALRAVAERRLRPDALVLSAPMLGMAGPPLPLPALQFVAKLMTLLGDPARQAWKWSEKPGEVPAARANLLTHDPERYADELWWRDARPELVMGPGSWRWVERAYASCRKIFSDSLLEAIDIPVLAIATTSDKLVRFSAIEQACRRIPNAELARFGPDAHHEILREVDEQRDRAMVAIREFLDRVAPPEQVRGDP